jgi:isopentenyl-diphosphate delta-isomerase
MGENGMGEQVVLLNDDGQRVGAADKYAIHGPDTPLHLAFSCYLSDEAGRLLMTRRALSKITWPGVWSNAFCGHPGPDEDVVDAVHRRAKDELGLEVTDIRPLLPDFRYRAVDASGVVENEICPVFSARTSGSPEPAADEVAEFAWADWDDLVATVRSAPWALSPWSVEQVTALVEAGWRPGA